mmetsp:Transcript_5430/g.15536  ORF Transcript_5430/g.15536 Transcript_5430/m.15536 type:complete len:347 (-) Transcript_5430:891-1931(-)
MAARAPYPRASGMSAPLRHLPGAVKMSTLRSHSAPVLPPTTYMSSTWRLTAVSDTPLLVRCGAPGCGGLPPAAWSAPSCWRRLRSSPASAICPCLSSSFSAKTACTVSSRASMPVVLLARVSSLFRSARSHDRREARCWGVKLRVIRLSSFAAGASRPLPGEKVTARLWSLVEEGAGEETLPRLAGLLLLLPLVGGTAVNDCASGCACALGWDVGPGCCCGCCCWRGDPWTRRASAAEAARALSRSLASCSARLSAAKFWAGAVWAWLLGVLRPESARRPQAPETGVATGATATATAAAPLLPFLLVTVCQSSSSACFVATALAAQDPGAGADEAGESLAPPAGWD